MLTEGLFHRAFESGDAGCWQELLDATRATAFGLAELHQCGCTYGEQVTWDHELETLRAKHDKLAAAVPSLRDHTGPALERIQAAAARAPADPFVPTHHSFRPAQVLLRDDGVSFIDFDKFCLAEAGSDIAVLTTKLLYMGVNKVGAPVGGRAADRDVRLAELRTAFLHEYGRHAVASVDRVALWEALELFSLVLSAAKKAHGPRVESCALMLQHHLSEHGL